MTHKDAHCNNNILAQNTNQRGYMIAIVVKDYNNAMWLIYFLWPFVFSDLVTVSMF